MFIYGNIFEKKTSKHFLYKEVKFFEIQIFFKHVRRYSKTFSETYEEIVGFQFFLTKVNYLLNPKVFLKCEQNLKLPNIF